MEQNEFESHAQLVALNDAVQPATLILAEAVVSLGRIAGNHVVVTGEGVSRLHARIERRGPRYFLIDAGSTNGTFLNDLPVREPFMLRDHDRIRLGLGTAQLRFVDPDPTRNQAGRLFYDPRLMQFSLDQTWLQLAPASFRLLLYLYHNQGRVCLREECAQAIWGANYAPGTDASNLDKVVHTLRAALRAVDPHTEFVHSRRGQGFILIATNAAPSRSSGN